MSVPGFPCIMASYLSQGEQGGRFNICPYLVVPVSCLPTYRKLKKGLVLPYACAWLPFYLSQREQGGGPMSCPSMYRKANKGVGFYTGLYLACCPSTYRKVKTGWFSHMCVPGFPLVRFSNLSQGERSVVLTHACTPGFGCGMSSC